MGKKIALCGSLRFASDTNRIRDKLTSSGHQIIILENTEKKQEKIDVIKNYFEKIKQADSILIINKTKNGIPGYISGNSLIEMAFAHVNNKKIYLLHPAPKMAYSDEIQAMNPVCIQGNFDKLMGN